MSFNFQPDYELEMLGQVYQQWRDDPRIRALVGGIADALQLFETDMLTYYSASRLEVASGKLLDEWGALIDEPRLGADDETYRRAILAKPAAFRSDGTRERLVQMVNRFIGDGGTVQYYDAYPAALRITVQRVEPFSDSEAYRLKRYLEMAVATGVGFEIVYGNNVNTFRFDDPLHGFDRGLFGSLI